MTTFLIFVLSFSHIYALSMFCYNFNHPGFLIVFPNKEKRTKLKVVLAETGHHCYLSGLLVKSPHFDARAEDCEQTCSGSACTDSYHTPAKCENWAGKGECNANPGFMLKKCRKSCGECSSDTGCVGWTYEVAKRKCSMYTKITAATPQSGAVSGRREGTSSRLCTKSAAKDECDAPPTALPQAEVERLNLDTSFYKKYKSLDGLPLIASAAVSDEAFTIACRIAEHMTTKRPDVVQQMIKNKLRVGIIGKDEQTTDLPEHSDLDTAFPRTDGKTWSQRARGLGATFARPLVSCGEEKLLGLLSAKNRDEDIFLHEFAHAFFNMGAATLPNVGRDHKATLKSIHKSAMSKGLWQNTYAASNEKEYWAEGVQAWFDVNAESRNLHNHVNTREELKKYDPTFAKFISQFFD